jgi:hypothetical protein
MMPSNLTPAFWSAAVAGIAIIFNLAGHALTADQQGLIAEWLGRAWQLGVDAVSLAGMIYAAWHGVAQTKALNAAKATLRARGIAA